MRLFGAFSALVCRYDGEWLTLVAVRGGLPGSGDFMMDQMQAPWRPRGGTRSD